MAKYVGFKIGKVHESHLISEYYCGGCGWPVTDHDSFCPECGGAFRECDASNLESENAKLREQIHWLKKGDILHVLTDQEYIDQCERERLMQVSIDALDKENDKLRELCTDFMAMLTLAGLEGLRVEATIGGVTKTYDASELCDKVEELFDEVS